MGPRSEPHPIIELVVSIAPWVWPATAAIIVGGLVVLTSLIGANQRTVSRDDTQPGRSVLAADRGTNY
jgi:hypothetical protein